MSPLSLRDTQREILGHPSNPIRDEDDHGSRASRSPSAPADPGLQEKLTTPILWSPDEHTEVNTDTYHSAIMTDSCDTSDDDVRPAKRRRRRSGPAVTSPHRLQLSPMLTTSIEADDAQPYPDREYSSSTVAGKKQHYDSRNFRSSSPVSEALPAADYQEWPFKGFFKRSRIGEDVTYSLEFRLPSTPDHPYLAANPSKAAFCSRGNTRPKPLRRTSYSSVLHSRTRSAKAKLPTTRNLWTKQEDRTVVKMKKDGCTWEDIHDALPHRSLGSIKVHYSTKLK